VRVPNFPFTHGEWKGWHAFMDSLEKIYALKVNNAREVFFLETNRYPRDPAEMADRGLLSR
jgi:hypothetical protein